MESDSASRAVKILSILTFIGAGLSLLFGVLFITAGASVGSGDVAIEDPNLAALGVGLIGSIFLGLGIFLVLWGLFAIAVGRGLWLSKPWARAVMVIMSWVGAVIGVLLFLASVMDTYFGGMLVYALWVALCVIYLRVLQFTPEVRALFGGAPVATVAATETPAVTTTPTPAPAETLMLTPEPVQATTTTSASKTSGKAPVAKTPVKAPAKKKVVKKVVKKTTKRR